MPTLQFTGDHIEQLAYQRFHHPHPRLHRKMEAVFLKAKGVTSNEVCQLVGISRTTLWG